MNPLTCDWHDLGPYAPMVFGTTPGMRFDVFGTSAQVWSDPLRGTRFFKVEVGYPDTIRRPNGSLPSRAPSGRTCLNGR